jgi:glutamine synthetase type III
LRLKIQFNPIKIKKRHKMTNNNIRFEAVKMALNHEPIVTDKTNTRASVIFAQNVFTREKMQEYIASNILDELFELMDNEKTLSRDIANSVAIGMKKWAMDHGATHYTHWFQPLTGGTAEKHDAFLILMVTANQLRNFRVQFYINKSQTPHPSLLAVFATHLRPADIAHGIHRHQLL